MTVYELLMLLATIVTAFGGAGLVVVPMQTCKGQMNAHIFTELNERYDVRQKIFPKKRSTAGSILKMWQGEMLRASRSPLFRHEWKTLASEFISYPAFLKYVERVQSTSNNNP